MMGVGPFPERWRHVTGRTGLTWPLRLRWLLLMPFKCRWNAWVRDFTARLEGHRDYEDETTEPRP